MMILSKHIFQISDKCLERTKKIAELTDKNLLHM